MVTSFAFFLAIGLYTSIWDGPLRGAAISFFLMGLVTITSSHIALADACWRASLDPVLSSIATSLLLALAVIRQSRG